MNRFSEFKKHLWSENNQPDVLSQTMFKSWDELFGMNRAEVEVWQLNAAKERVKALLPQIETLSIQAEDVGFDTIDTLNDITPLLFQHTQYKAYPMSFLEKGRFDMLTQWLDGLTSVDLSAIDARGCESIDEWLQLIEDNTNLQMFHTTGTSGKLSFFPRTDVERDLFVLGLLKMFEGFGDSPGVNLGFDGLRLPCIYPSLRNSRYAAQQMVKFLALHLTPTPEQCYTLSDGTLSADVVSLSGRIRVAQAKGQLQEMQLSKTMRAALKQYLADMERRPQEVDDFMKKMMNELNGQQAYVYAQTNYMTQTAIEGLSRGIKNVFSSDSVGSIGGGGKGMVLPDNWRELVTEFSGISNWKSGYGMTELIGSIPLCDHGVYHIPLYHIPFLLDPENGNPLPRSGKQTGRFAFLDLSAQSYWGGLVTGDKTTIEWDKECPCGRKGAYLYDDIVRYSEAVTGDDRVTCAETIDNTDTALQALLAI